MATHLDGDVDTGKATVDYANDGVALVTQGNLAVCVLSVPITLEHLHELRRQSERLQARFGLARVTLNVVESAAMAAPDDAVRAESEALARDYPSSVLAIVFEGTGFRKAAVRAIMNSVALISNYPGKRRTFDTVESMVFWVTTNNYAGALRSRDLRALISQARTAAHCR